MLVLAFQERGVHALENVMFSDNPMCRRAGTEALTNMIHIESVVSVPHACCFVPWPWIGCLPSLCSEKPHPWRAPPNLERLCQVL